MIEGKDTNFKATRANDRRQVLRIPIVLGFCQAYVGMIFEEVRARPMYLMETEHGFEAEEAIA